MLSLILFIGGPCSNISAVDGAAAANDVPKGMDADADAFGIDDLGGVSPAEGLLSLAATAAIAAAAVAAAVAAGMGMSGWALFAKEKRLELLQNGQLTGETLPEQVSTEACFSCCCCCSR